MNNSHYENFVNKGKKNRLEAISLTILSGMVSMNDQYESNESLVHASIKMAQEFIKQIDKAKVE